jgi:predicted ATP-dependent serine protease
MFIFYECNVCGYEKSKPLKLCPACQIGDMIAMTVIRKDVLDKLKLKLQYYQDQVNELNKSAILRKFENEKEKDL